MTSVEIAEVTGKSHAHILRDIRKMEPAWEKVNQSKFGLVEYKDSKGEMRPMYNLTKTECLYIATKFNDEARARLVLRWEELERRDIESRQYLTKLIDTASDYVDYLERENSELRLQNADRCTLLSMLLSAEKKLGLLRKKNELLEGRLFGKYSYATYSVSELARQYGIKASDLNKILSVMGVQYRDKEGVWKLSQPYTGYGYTTNKRYVKKDGTVGSYMVWTELGRRCIDRELKSFESNEYLKGGVL